MPAANGVVLSTVVVVEVVSAPCPLHQKGDVHTGVLGHGAAPTSFRQVVVLVSLPSNAHTTARTSSHTSNLLHLPFSFTSVRHNAGYFRGEQDSEPSLSDLHEPKTNCFPGMCDHIFRPKTSPPNVDAESRRQVFLRNHGRAAQKKLHLESSEQDARQRASFPSKLSE